MFVRAVARNRNVSLATVRDGFGQGDMVDAEPAVGRGHGGPHRTLDETLQRFGASQYRRRRRRHEPARRHGAAPALRALDSPDLTLAPRAVTPASDRAGRGLSVRPVVPSR